MTRTRRRAGEDGQEFDVIVCGAGSSGSVVAGRLSADPDVRVLLLEAGPDDESPLVQDPDMWPANLGSERTWPFIAAPDPALNGRSLDYAMGRGLGGGGSVNLSVWARGHRSDWDSFADTSGNADWGYGAVLDLYRRVEDYSGSPDPARRGVGGPIPVERSSGHPFFDAVLEASEAAGLPYFDDPNGRLAEVGAGVAMRDQTVRDGVRVSPYRAYVHPHLDRQNLTVVTDALVSRVLFEGTTAVGVEYRTSEGTTAARASVEVVLSMGALQTPKVLMQSGIGDADTLQHWSIVPRQHLPGVGRNLDDHMQVACVWEWADAPMPPPTRANPVAYWNRDGSDVPEFVAYTAALPFLSPESAAVTPPPERGYTTMVGMRPSSRGQVHLTGPGPDDPIRIETGFMSDPADLQGMIDAVETVRAIGNADSLRPFRRRAVTPGDLDPEGMAEFVRRSTGTFWHQSGTARMGQDEEAVVTGNLTVRGMTGLRIADASVLPHVTAANTMAPAVIVGMRAADEIRATHDLSAGI